MRKIHIFLIAAARPNFMKVAPLYHALRDTEWALPRIIHTGQHYDLNMSDSFFRDLGLPEPYVNLEVGSGTHAEQTGRVMAAFERLAAREKPDLTVVVGDVNSTLACTVAAVKLHLRVAHLEAGLRSFDRSMPEEINRLVTDTLADILWTPSPDGDENLRREGVAPEKIRRVGNIMIDSLELLRSGIEQQNSLEDFGLTPGDYAVVTLHRPANVDDPRKLALICDTLLHTARKIRLVFPVHPRTEKQLRAHGLYAGLCGNGRLAVTDPLNYLSFMKLVFHARFLLTDSGGIQEETTYLGIPCLTLRENTERPVTVSQGTNRLCSLDTVRDRIDESLSSRQRTSPVPELWDGRTARRVVAHIADIFGIQ